MDVLSGSKGDDGSEDTAVHRGSHRILGSCFPRLPSNPKTSLSSLKKQGRGIMMFSYASSHSRAGVWLQHLPGTGGWEEITDLITDVVSEMNFII